MRYLRIFAFLMLSALVARRLFPVDLKGYFLFITCCAVLFFTGCCHCPQRIDWDRIARYQQEASSGLITQGDCNRLVELVVRRNVEK